jgi:hypothetical protein
MEHSLNRNFGIIRLVFHIAMATGLIFLLHLPTRIHIGLFVVAVLGFVWLYRPPVIGEPMYGPSAGSEDMAGPGPSEHP